MDLTEFFMSGRRNAWLNEKGIAVYVRRSMRKLDGRMIGVFDIANIEAVEPGNGSFTAFLDRAEPSAASAGLVGIYVENILNERLPPFLERRGYSRTNGEDVCMWKLFGPPRFELQ